MNNVFLREPPSVKSPHEWIDEITVEFLKAGIGGNFGSVTYPYGNFASCT